MIKQCCCCCWCCCCCCCYCCCCSYWWWCCCCCCCCCCLVVWAVVLSVKTGINQCLCPVRLQVQKTKHEDRFRKADYTKCQSRTLLVLPSTSQSPLLPDNLRDDSVGLWLYMQCSFRSSEWTAWKDQQLVESKEI